MINKRVSGFFESIASGDIAKVYEHFPGLQDLSEVEQEGYISVFGGFDQWMVRSIAIEGVNGVATVEVVTGGGPLTIQLPLIYKNRRWIITERTTMQRKLDVVPAR